MNRENESFEQFKAGVFGSLLYVGNDIEKMSMVMKANKDFERLSKKIEIQENKCDEDSKMMKDVEERAVKSLQHLDRILNMQQAVIEELDMCSKQFVRPLKYFALNLLDGTDEREALNAKSRMVTRCLKDTQDLVNSKRGQVGVSHFLAELEKLEMQLVRFT